MIHDHMMKNFAAFFKSYRWPLLSGLMIGTSYVPFPPWAVVFCYVPLWLWLDEDVATTRKAFFGAWITQFVLTMIGFHWIAFTAAEFGGFPWPVAGLTLILFSAFVHLHIPISVLIFMELKKRLKLQGGIAFLTMALIFILIERIWPMIFQWHLGYTLLWAKLPIAQLADIVGFDGLSAMLFLLNAWIAIIWQRQDDTPFIFRHAPLFAALIVALTVGGLFRKRPWKVTDDSVNVLAVQANIGNADKIFAEKGADKYQANIMYDFINLTQKGLSENPTTELILWPETALPDYPDQPSRSQKRLDLISSGLGSFNRPILTGAYARPSLSKPVDPSKKGNGSYNAMFLLTSHGQVMTEPYRKTELLAFGEYLPFSDQFPSLLKMLPFISNFGRGEGPMTIDWQRPGRETLKLGGQICYEGLFPEFTRGLALAGSQLLVNVTNDSWFGTPFEPRQHLIMTLARAIEVRRPMVRSTNTGISTAILASGEQLKRSPSDKEWTGMFQIPYKKDPDLTFYTRFGHFDWVVWCLLLIGVLAKGWKDVGSARARLERGS
jgi:apolipoprotein N-acyltransferase